MSGAATCSMSAVLSAHSAPHRPAPPAHPPRTQRSLHSELGRRTLGAAAHKHQTQLSSYHIFFIVFQTFLANLHTQYCNR